MSDKKTFTPQEADQYMMDKIKFVPRMFKIINQVKPASGVAFADFYDTLWEDGALSRKVKELMFMSGGVAYCSPRCIIHVLPAVNSGATVEEVFEAAAIGMILGGFVPGGPGIPYAFEYAYKCVELAQKMIAGEPWEYLPAPKWDHGVF
ncbi:MAG: carboxymuconolactone decarboxylase family protein [Thermincola sp.]|jgi:alkylhydroperoxidase/carboxymuconolactone decarboxylase family protein YurZ|nr:carboxymuconolactone decarboxylase family protein [Thermincola sp.]MDT3702229.1 carboxymuconolactone decarboxylase family protein [Thermincola sp.]